MIIWKGITEMGCKCLSFLPPSELASSTVSVHGTGDTLPFGRRPGQQQQANILGVMALKVFLHLTRRMELQVDKSCELEKAHPGSCHERVNMETLQCRPQKCFSSHL